MNCTHESVWRTDSGRRLLTLRTNNSVYIDATSCDADELEELAKACFEAAEIIRKRMRQQANEAHAEVAS